MSGADEASTRGKDTHGVQRRHLAKSDHHRADDAACAGQERQEVVVLLLEAAEAAG